MTTSGPADDRQIIALESQLRARFTRPLPGGDAHHRYAPHRIRPHWEPGVLPDGARRAAVLLLLYPGAQGVSLPLTVRHAQLAHHAGQISLPGGALHPGETPETAALRETEEEIGVTTNSVRIVGALSPLWVFVSNFVVHPFVAVAHRPPVFHPDPAEVDTLLHVPLDHLTAPARVKQRQRSRDGFDLTYSYFELDEGHEVWGATAMILGEFVALFDEL